MLGFLAVYTTPAECAGRELAAINTKIRGGTAVFRHGRWSGTAGFPHPSCESRLSVLVHEDWNG
tara:strand:- start:416 stop:607 length:192 start_codon:yes stop_codon:yes gene_type:complete